MKKLLTLLLAAAMLIYVSACTKEESESTAENETGDIQTESSEVTGEDTTDEDTAAEGTTDETDEDVGEADDTDESESDTQDAETVTFDYNSVLTEDGYFKDVKAYEIVSLPTYIGVDINKADIMPTDEEINSEIEYYFQSYPVYKELELDRAIEDGDTVNIDYVGSVDGVAFDGGSTEGQGTYVTIGVTSYIDDFLEQLIGHSVGETVNIEVTFPDDYGVDELNGKDAVFVTTINSFGTPDYDGFAQLFGFVDEAVMRDYLNTQLYYSKVAQCVGTILGEAVCEEIPQSVIDYTTESQIDYMVSMYAQYGLTRDVLLPAFGYESTEAYFEDNKDSIMDSAALSLAFQAVAELEGLSVTDEYYEQMGITDEDIESMGRGYLNQSIIMSALVPDFIIDRANIIE